MNSLEFCLQDRLVSIIDSILSNKEFQLSWIRKRKYLEDQASIIKELEIEMPEVWVPLRLACSGLLTQRTNLKKTNCPNSLAEWKKVWEELSILLMNKESLASEFTLWLKKRGNHRYAVKLGLYYESYWKSRQWSIENSKQDLEDLRSLNSGNDVKKWWLEFAGIGNQYAKNIPMDEMDSRFMEFVKIDFRLSKIVDLLGGASLSASEKQELYLKVATKLNMSPWEIDRFCFNFYNEILSRIKLI